MKTTNQKLTQSQPQVDPARLPTDPTSGASLAPQAQPGYYPGYEVMSQQKFWDEATRKVILDRINNVPPIRFFTEDEAHLMQAICERIMPQDDRDEAHTIPIVPFIDERLYSQRI
ncbi:MAG: gluconate 2-dehydrogenase subunit 3 family protein, partial [Chloroflexota bacterium]|nr:gluconate 2-dehydrogenase subunit 3 family protein [Chloroflexota bacterium]